MALQSVPKSVTTAKMAAVSAPYRRTVFIGMARTPVAVCHHHSGVDRGMWLKKKRIISTFLVGTYLEIRDYIANLS